MGAYFEGYVPANSKSLEISYRLNGSTQGKILIGESGPTSPVHAQEGHGV